jgi:hypothetical protein
MRSGIPMVQQMSCRRVLSPHRREEIQINHGDSCRSAD